MGDFEIFLGGIVTGAIIAFGLLFVALLIHEWIVSRPDRIRARRKAISDAYSDTRQKARDPEEMTTEDFRIQIALAKLGLGR